MQVDPGRGDDDDRQDHRHGCTVAVPVEGEGLAVHRQGERLGLGAGAALGEQPDQVEGLQTVDDRDADHDDGHRPQLRHDHLGEHPHPAGPVEPTRLDGLGGDRLEADQEQDQRRAGALPGGDDDHGDRVQRPVQQPFLLQSVEADGGQQLIDRTVALQHEGPHQRRRRAGQCVRDGDGPPRHDAPADTVEQDGEDQAQQDRKDECAGNPHQGVDDGVPETGVGEQRTVVLQAHKGSAQAVVGEEAVAGGDQERHDQERDDQPDRDEQESEGRRRPTRPSVLRARVRGAGVRRGDVAGGGGCGGAHRFHAFHSVSARFCSLASVGLMLPGVGLVMNALRSNTLPSTSGGGDASQ